MNLLSMITVHALLGVTVPGNRRPRRPIKTKGSGRKLQEVKAKIPAKQPVLVENLSPETTNTLNDVSRALHGLSIYWHILPTV